MLISGLRDLYLSFNALFQFSELHFSSSSVSVLDMFFYSLRAERSYRCIFSNCMSISGAKAEALKDVNPETKSVV